MSCALLAWFSSLSTRASVVDLRPLSSLYLRRDINHSTGRPFSAAGMYAGKSLITMANVEYQSACGILLCRREEVLSASRVLYSSESVVSLFHLVPWMSSLLRSGVCLLLLGFFVAFLICWGHSVFCISPVLSQLSGTPSITLWFEFHRRSQPACFVL